MLKKVFCFCFVLFFIVQVYATDFKTSLIDKEFLVSQDIDEDMELYDKNGNRIIFVDGSKGANEKNENKTSGQNSAQPSINILNSNTALTPYNLSYYNENKKSTIGAILCSGINFFTGLGIGSYIQGDDAGGGRALLTDIAGALLFGIGFGVVELVYASVESDYSDYNVISWNNPGYITGVTVGSIGVVTLLVNRIIQVFRPYSYKNSYNSTLYRSLLGFGGLALDVIPALDDNLNLKGAKLIGKVSF